MHPPDEPVGISPPAWRYGEASHTFRVPALRGLDGGDLIAELAHTLRSRLTTMLLLAESLYLATPREESTRRRQLGLLYGSALGASVFTSNLMELVRGRGDLLGAEPEPLSVADLLARIRDEIAPLAEERGLALRVSAPGGAGLGHPMALHRVLLGLAMVVLEFTDDGVIELTATAGDPRWELSIHAPGATIRADSMAGLERSVEPREGGTGWAWSPVGVAITTARQLCRKMDARLRIDGGAGRGLRLRVDLPLPPS